MTVTELMNVIEKDIKSRELSTMSLKNMEVIMYYHLIGVDYWSVGIDVENKMGLRLREIDRQNHLK